MTDHAIPYRVVAVTSIILAFAASARAFDAPPTTDRSFMITSPPPPPSVQPQLVGGSAADLATWQASLLFHTATTDCTATVIGPQTILTAAHCVRNGRLGSIRLRDFSSDVTCTRHPNYEGESNHIFDIALCLIDTPIPRRILDAYERVNLDSARPVAGDVIVLQGFGCVTKSGPMADVLYVGTATIFGHPHEINLIRASGESSLCEGDSGGSAFLQHGLSRNIIGVNTSASTQDGREASILVGTGAAAIAKFLKDWPQVICGRDTLDQCHG